MIIRFKAVKIIVTEKNRSIYFHLFQRYYCYFNFVIRKLMEQDKKIKHESHLEIIKIKRTYSIIAGKIDK